MSSTTKFDTVCVDWINKLFPTLIEDCAKDGIVSVEAIEEWYLSSNIQEIIELIPQKAREESKGKRGRPKKSVSNKPKGALSAFHIYAREHRAEVKAANPDSKVSEISKILSAKWNEMKDTDGAEKYKKLSAADKERYLKEMETYVPTDDDKAKEAEKAAKKAEREVKKAAKKAEREAEKAAKKVEREAEKAAKKVEREAEKAERKAMREAEKETKKAAKKTTATKKKKKTSCKRQTPSPPPTKKEVAEMEALLASVPSKVVVVETKTTKKATKKTKPFDAFFNAKISEKEKEHPKAKAKELRKMLRADWKLVKQNKEEYNQYKMIAGLLNN